KKQMRARFGDIINEQKQKQKRKEKKKKNAPLVVVPPLISPADVSRRATFSSGALCDPAPSPSTTRPSDRRGNVSGTHPTIFSSIPGSSPRKRCECVSNVSTSSKW